MRIEANLASEAAEVETVTTAGIENDVARACDHHLRDGAQQRLGHAEMLRQPQCPPVALIAALAAGAG
jgi:hypothetical protein